MHVSRRGYDVDMERSFHLQAAIEDNSSDEGDVHVFRSLSTSKGMYKKRRGSESPPILAVETTQVCEACHTFIYMYRNYICLPLPSNESFNYGLWEG